jgi:hypothetical protein
MQFGFNSGLDFDPSARRTSFLANAHSLSIINAEFPRQNLLSEKSNDVHP